MKKLITIVGMLVLVWGIASVVEINLKQGTDNEPLPTNLLLLVFDHNERCANGYYDNGTIYTDDGHIWGYTDDSMSNGRVTVTFDKRCTWFDITDDVILDVAPIN